MKTRQNFAQKLVLAIFLPVIMFGLVYGLVPLLMHRTVEGWEGRGGECAPEDDHCAYLNLSWPDTTVSIEWDDFDETWWVWLSALVALGVLEWMIFQDSKQHP